MSAKQISAKELFNQLMNEIRRLHKLCRDNGIDPTPPRQGGKASLKVTPEVKIFKTKEEAEEYQKKSLNR